jgi:carbonic anhydrase
VVVLGHSQCGAITATLDELEAPSNHPRNRNIQSIVDRVRPAIAGLLATDLRNDREALIKHAVRANIRASVDHLRHG